MFSKGAVREWTDACGGRRFLLALGCGIVNTILVVFKAIDGNIYRDVILGTVAVYIGSATYQRAKEYASQ